MICKHCGKLIKKCDGGDCGFPTNYCNTIFKSYYHTHSMAHSCGGSIINEKAEPEITEETKEINFKELCENAADRVVDIIVDIYGSAGKEMFRQAIVFIIKEELDKMTLSA